MEIEFTNSSSNLLFWDRIQISSRDIKFDLDLVNFDIQIRYWISKFNFDSVNFDVEIVNSITA